MEEEQRMVLLEEKAAELRHAATTLELEEETRRVCRAAKARAEEDVAMAAAARLRDVEAQEAVAARAARAALVTVVARATEAARIAWDTFTQLDLEAVELAREIAALQARLASLRHMQRSGVAASARRERRRQSCRRRCGTLCMTVSARR
jgi:hypothetical protein